MTTNNPPIEEKDQISASPALSDCLKDNIIPKPAREFTNAERLLVFVALAIAILCDRLLFAPLFWREFHLPFFSAIFWLAFLLIFYAVFWKKLKSNKILWMVAGFLALLCAWNLVFDYNSDYGIVTMLVIPPVTMAHVVFSAGGNKLKGVNAIALAWLSGWFIKPFSAIHMLIGAAGSMTAGAKKTTMKNVIAGILCTLPVILVVVPLLGSADLVFGYYLQQLLNGFDIAPFAAHTIAVIIAATLFYSFLWNIGFAEQKQASAKKEISIDRIISCMVLGTVVTIYVLFCIVQFTYLFAGAGLPSDMTYSEYAREGFAQIIVICAINLCLFGVFLQYGKKHQVVSILLISLLCLSGVMLVSSFVRLNLYITAYGMTWLRLLSAWFIFYLAAVIILSFVRLWKDKLPLIAVSAFVLLGWYTILGYANPDAIIMKYNLQANGYSTVWIQENSRYINSLSDDAILTLLNRELDMETITPIIQHRIQERQGYSLSSYRLEKVLSQYGRGIYTA